MRTPLEHRGTPKARGALPHPSDRARAAEAGVSRACLSKWKNRYDTHGEVGLQDRPSVPRSSPTQTPPDVVERIERSRRDNKWSARRTTLEPAGQGVQISERNRRPVAGAPGHQPPPVPRPDGSANRRPSKRIVARYPGHMVHLDVKKVGRIPDGGGWRATDAAPSRPGPRSARRPVAPRAVRLPALCRRRILPLGPHRALPDEKAATTVAFLSRAAVFERSLISCVPAEVREAGTRGPSVPGVRRSRACTPGQGRWISLQHARRSGGDSRRRTGKRQPRALRILPAHARLGETVRLANRLRQQ